MIPYGKTKRRGTLHPHNECGVCSEQNFTKSKARQAGKKQILRELNAL